MPTILVVCTGNVCRSPVAEAALTRALQLRLGEAAPTVSSAGTAGWQGSGATREAIEAAAELDLDISGHVARMLMPAMIEAADLIVCMAAEHRDEVASHKAYTLKELVRLVESLPPPEPDETLTSRLEQAETARAAGVETNPWDHDIQDPMSLSFATYRAISWEIVEWSNRLVDSLYGPAPRWRHDADPAPR
jgi:protein-tyrosine phosphatase